MKLDETTKRRGWFLTVPARQDEECDCEDDKHSCAFTADMLHAALSGIGYTGQLEEGDGGFLHWQVFVHGPSPIAFGRIRRGFQAVSTRGINIEVPRDFAACQRYVCKEDTRVGEPFRSETYKPVKEKKAARKTLEELREQVLSGVAVDDLLLEESMTASTLRVLREVEQARLRKLAQSRPIKPLDVRYIYGKSGVGKSYMVYSATPRDCLYVAADKNLWDSYNGESVVLIDEFSDDRLPLTELLNVLDAYTPRLSARYHNRIGLFDKVYILSNVSLSAHYRDEPDERFNALCRRITTYAEMTSRGVLEDREKPLRAVKELDEEDF